jgi:hypothetical protein
MEDESSAHSEDPAKEACFEDDIVSRGSLTLSCGRGSGRAGSCPVVPSERECRHFFSSDQEQKAVDAIVACFLERLRDTVVVGALLGWLFRTRIEPELLGELKRSLTGEHSGPKASRQAAKIVAAVSDVMRDAQNAQSDAQGA